LSLCPKKNKKKKSCPEQGFFHSKEGIQDMNVMQISQRKKKRRKDNEI